MPLYEYRCTSCGHSFEKIQSFSAEPEKECPKCQGALIRPVTAPALRFEGAGWYVNDYAGKGGAKKPEGDGAVKDSKGETKSGESSPVEAKPAASGPGTPAPAGAQAAASAAASSATASSASGS